MIGSEPDPVDRVDLPLLAVPLGFVVGNVAAALIVSIVLAVAGPGTAASLAGSIGLWVGFVGVPLVVLKRAGTSLEREFSFTSRPLVDAVVGLPLGVVLQVGVVPAAYWALERWTGPLDVDEAARLLTEDASGLWWMGVIAIVGIGAPIAEEIFFRGLLLQSVGQRFGAPAGVVISSLLFAASHFQVVQFPGLLVAGLSFAVLAARSRRLGLAVACHAGFNLAAVAGLIIGTN